MPGGNAVASGFVGREREVAALATVLRDAARGRGPAAAAVVGAPGIGKSRLLSRVAGDGAGMHVVRLRGFEPERHVPLAAAAGMLRALTKAGPESERLTALLTATANPGEGLESLRLFEATYRALTPVASTLVIVDDLQWVDDLSRSLLHYLVRAAVADHVPLVMLCATRPAPESFAFLGSVGELVGDPTRFLELTLGPLDRADGVRLAQVVDASLDEHEAEQLWASGSGSPFWIEVAARTRKAASDPAALIGRSLRELGADAAAALAALVVVARPVAVADAADVLRWPVGRTEHALGELVGRGLATTTAGMFQCAHDLVRDAAFALIPDRQLTSLHEVVAQHMRRSAGGDLHLLMEALEHADAAGSATVEQALEIARSPQRRLLAHAGLERLSAIADRPSADAATTLALKLELAGLAAELSDHEAACDRFAELADRLPTTAERATAALTAARHAVEVDRSALAAKLLAQVRRDAGDDAWSLVAADALDYHRFAWLEHDAAAARPCRERAIARAHALVAAPGSIDELDLAARQAYSEALDAQRVALLMDDDMLGMLAASDELADASRGLGERHLDAKLGSHLALRFLNRWRETEQRVRTTLREAEQQIYPGVAANAAYELALAVFTLGRVGEAAEHYAEARRLAARVGTAIEVADTALAGLGDFIGASTGDWRTAARSLREAADGQRNPHLRLILRQRAATCLARFAPAESTADVIALLEAGDDDAVAADCVRCLWELRVVSAEMFARVGELARARELLQRWDATHPTPHPRATFMRAYTDAVVAAAAGAADAPDRLRASAQSSADEGLRLDQVWALIDLGDALVGSDAAGAIEAWSDAAMLAGDLGAASEEALVRRRLRDVGVRRATPPRATGVDPVLSTLSRRELDVARLAAAGARNSDIAKTLFISAKTVEQHLSHVFAKLDVRNRTELGVRYAAAFSLDAEPAAARNEGIPRYRPA